MASKSPRARLLHIRDEIEGVGWTFAAFLSRNILRHEYQRLDDKQLWEIATVHMPKLEPVVARMLAEIEN